MYRALLRSLILLGCLILLSGGVLPAAEGGGPVTKETPSPTVLARAGTRFATHKVTAGLQAALAANGGADFLVFIKGRPDLSPARSLPTKEAKGTWVYNTLRHFAEESQADLRQLLQARGVEYQSFWIVNMLRVRGSASLVAELAQRPEVLKIGLNRRFRALPPFEPQPVSPVPLHLRPPVPLLLEPTAQPWGVSRIGAPQVWDLGIRGQGIVVAGADTGVDWEHEALIGQYRGWNGQTADHNYNWHDAWNETPTFPSDDQGHGTHTIGTVAGGGPRHVGVAPGTRWIACRNMDNGFGTPASYVDCFQFFLAPTDLAGENPRPELAPHVINNSWACIEAEGCHPDDPTWQDTIQPAVEALTAAGIAVVASAGNWGTLGCSTVYTPPAIYAAAISVGASDRWDAIAGFSSRGPITVNGRNDPAPDLTAPGVDVLSSVPGDLYSFGSGTSMAGPHVAGTIALLWSAAPRLIGRLAVTEQVLRASAVPRSDLSCGGDADGQPNNVYGWGIIDVEAGVAAMDTLGEITGTVTDGEGAPLAGADVTVFDETWDVQIDLVTDAQGMYSTPILPGTYRVAADTDAHFAETRSVHVPVAGTANGDLTLRLCVDWNGDGRTGLAEMESVAGDWGNPDFAPRHDINGDGRVDVVDLMELARHWDEPCLPQFARDGITDARSYSSFVTRRDLDHWRRVRAL